MSMNVEAYHQTAFKEELHTSYTNLIANGEGDPRIIMVRGDPRKIMVRGDPRIITVRVGLHYNNGEGGAQNNNG